MDTIELEERRLMALRRYGLLDTAPEAIFDGVTVAIANICEVPIALVSLVDDDRQWFKSAYGLRVSQTPRDVAFCSHAIEQPQSLMIVEDASQDERFCRNPLVMEDPNIRFYAGKPIVTNDGHALGTLCVIDRKPRKLRTYQLEALKALSDTVSAILDERYRLQKIAIDRDGMEELFRQSDTRYRHLYQDTASILEGALNQFPTAALAVNAQGTVVSINNAWRQFATHSGWTLSLQGNDFLEACNHQSAPFSSKSREVRFGLLQVLSGENMQFCSDYQGSNGLSTIDIRPVSSPGSGAIVQHFQSANH